VIGWLGNTSLFLISQPVWSGPGCLQCYTVWLVACMHASRFPRVSDWLPIFSLVFCIDRLTVYIHACWVALAGPGSPEMHDFYVSSGPGLSSTTAWPEPGWIACPGDQSTQCRILAAWTVGMQPTNHPLSSWHGLFIILNSGEEFEIFLGDDPSLKVLLENQ
jgi:hypothetical protein